MVSPTNISKAAAAGNEYLGSTYIRIPSLTQHLEWRYVSIDRGNGQQRRTLRQRLDLASLACKRRFPSVEKI